MAQAFAAESFANYTTITDIILALDKLAERGANIFTSDGGTRSAQDLLSDVVVGVGAAGALDQKTPPAELGRKLDQALIVITEGGGNIKLRSTIKTILLQSALERRPVLLPWTLITKIVNEAEVAIFRTKIAERKTVNLAKQPIVNNDAFQPLQAKSLNEFIAALLQRPTITIDGRRDVPNRECIAAVRAIVAIYGTHPAQRGYPLDLPMEYPNFIRERLAAGDQADRIFEVADRTEHSSEPGERQQTSFLSYESPPKRAPAVAVVPDQARVMPVRPARPAATPVELINSPRLFRWLTGLGVTAVTVATCSGAGISYLAAKKFGASETTPAAADAPPSDWRRCTAEEFEEINGKRLRVREHQWRFAETIARHANAGVSKDGAMNRDPLKVVASLAVVDEDVDNFFNLHQRTGDRILCFDEQPTIVTGANGERELDLPPLARMHQGGTLDNIADDVMGYNVYWLRQDAPTPSSATIWHEMGHKYKGGATHSTTITLLDRYDREFALAVLAEGDFSSYINLVVNTADYVVSTYIALIQQDIAKATDLTPETANQLANEYHIEPKEAKAWAESIAGTFMYSYTVLEPIGVTKETLAQALINGRMHEIANERVAEYFFELSNELRREQRREQEQQEETGDSDLRLPRDSGRAWR